MTARDLVLQALYLTFDDVADLPRRLGRDGPGRLSLQTRVVYGVTLGDTATLPLFVDGP
jgi:hypothetical protein